jgi:hypothetical protein
MSPSSALPHEKRRSPCLLRTFGPSLSGAQGHGSLTNHPLRSQSAGYCRVNRRACPQRRRPRPNFGISDHSYDWQIGVGRHII